jgi:hypothetical protein
MFLPGIKVNGSRKQVRSRSTLNTAAKRAKNRRRRNSLKK